MTIGEKLKQLRLARDWTVYRLAQETGLSRSNLARVESGQRQPTFELLAKIALALGADLGDFQGLDRGDDS